MSGKQLTLDARRRSEVLRLAAMMLINAALQLTYGISRSDAASSTFSGVAWYYFKQLVTRAGKL